MNLKQHIPLIGKPKPIVIIGAGGIVKDAHLPAYAMMDFRILAIYDIHTERSKALQAEFRQIENVALTLQEAIEFGKKEEVVYDLAVPAREILSILHEIPENSAVLIQKPMGETWAEAVKIEALCKSKNLKAAINFQLRFAPYCLAAKDMITQGLIGEIYDIELMVCVYTPWHLWDFLFSLPRVEILYHSIHYIDLIKNFLGVPRGVFANTVKHPKMKELASTRSTILLDYDEFTQARIITNHGHDFGIEKQESYLKIEGTKGAIKIRIGLSLDYPRGKPPQMEYYIHDLTEKWESINLEGGWFPHAFRGPMTLLQNYVADPTHKMEISVEESLHVMQLVEKAYESNQNKVYKS